MDWLNNLQEWLNLGMDDQGDWNSQKQNGPIHLKLCQRSALLYVYSES